MPASGVIRIRGQASPGTHHYGNKGLRLREVSDMGLAVPDGLLLSMEFLAARIKPETGAARAPAVSRGNGAGIDRDRAITLQDTADAHRLTRDLETDLRGLTGYRPNGRYAVRSAALGEDDANASYAGQFDTLLNVASTDVGPAIFKCYASWWSGPVAAYRNRTVPDRPDCDIPGMSVIVQHQLQPLFAGVLFTRHPLDNRRDVMVVEAVTGLGERLVSGAVSPSRWEIHRETGEIRTMATDGSAADSLPRGCLSRLLQVGKALEDRFESGQDIEWALEGDALYILQTRPITVPPRMKAAAVQATHPGGSDPTAATDISPDGDLFSRAMIEDLWADRMSEITSSIVFEELSDLYTFKGPLRALGLGRIADMAAIRVVNGYGYLNSRAVETLLAYIPRGWRFREIAAMFPPSMRKRILDKSFDLKGFLKILLRVPKLIQDPAQLPLLTERLLRRHLREVDDQRRKVPLAEYARMDPQQLGGELSRLVRLQGLLQTRNQWGYGKATIYTWLLRHVANRLGGRDDEWVLNQIAKIPRNVTSQCQNRLQCIAGMADQELRQAVFHGKYDATGVWQRLTTDFPSHPLTRAMKAFIQEYRFRSSNRDFINPRWDETPEILMDMLGSFVDKPDKMERREEAGNAGLHTHRPTGPGSAVFGVLAHPLVAGTRRYLALREDLRYGLDKVFHRIRRVLKTLAAHPSMAALQPVPDGIFFMALREIRDVLAGKSRAEDWLETVQRRSDAYYRQKSLSPPYYIRINEMTGEMHRLPEEPESAVMAGVAASPGIVEGPARLIRGAGDFPEFRRGEVLVACNTDPGWTPLFINAAGVVVEMGGILNHCAIVAREYGIPAVVGIEQATRRIETGQRVRVDGNSGVVEIL